MVDGPSHRNGHHQRYQHQFPDREAEHRRTPLGGILTPTSPRPNVKPSHGQVHGHGHQQQVTVNSSRSRMETFIGLSLLNIATGQSFNEFIPSTSGYRVR